MQLDDSEGSARLSVDSHEKKGIDPILILIPVSVLAGAFGCYFFMPKTKVFLLDYALWTSLVILYTSVGIGMGQNKSVFRYIKMVGFKIIYLVLGVWVGSMAGGAVAAEICCDFGKRCWLLQYDGSDHAV